jgi:uncharacterized OB-fold protein
MKTPYLPPLGIGRPQLPEHVAFWDHCSRRELRFQRCTSCSAVRHPSAPICPRCASSDVAWDLAPARAELFSYTVVHHAPTPALRASVPYNIAIVAFDGLDDVRLVSNVIDAAPDELRIGMPLALVWQERADGTVLPLFRKGEPT